MKPQKMFAAVNRYGWIFETAYRAKDVRENVGKIYLGELLARSIAETPADGWKYARSVGIRCIPVLVTALGIPSPKKEPQP